ncbi:MAG: TonB family protein [Bacteroidales bacterium]|nr:TonB family protein [Bacteroidales bacterium]
MTDISKPLVLNVVRSDQTRQFILGKGGKFTVGQKGNNDLILYGQNYPKQHTLIAQQNGAFQICIKPFITGEVSLANSTLRIDELIKHEVLPQNGDGYLLKLTPEKQGFLTLGDTKIEFAFKYIERKLPVVMQSPVFSWSRATAKSLASDLLFKFIFMFLFVLNCLVLYGLKDYEINIEKKFDIDKMPERLAKFIIKPPDELFEPDNRSISANLEGAEEADKSKTNNKKTSGQKGRKGGRKSRRGNPAASAGLLGLIGGTGSRSKSSSIVDALVDKGLVADLESILGGGSHLKVRKNGGKNETDPLDQLIGTGGSGGIDDWLDDMEEDVPQVTLKKQAKVDLIKPKKISGSKDALGHRSDQSIMDVVMSRKGQITYLYNKYLKRNPNLRGKISIEFTIAANGFVTKARVIEATISHPQLQRDLIRLIKRLKFDPIPSGSLTAVFPFQFSKPG